MKYAITFRKHVGPIQNSLRLFAEANAVDVLVTDPKNMNVAPKGYRWDDYDALIWFNNSPPTLETSAKIIWWMCDLRHPDIMKKNTPSTTASYIAISNRLFPMDYFHAYGALTVWVPPCGNDTPIVAGRTAGCDVLFIGNTGSPDHGPLFPGNAETLAQVTARDFHWNRLPVIRRLEEEDLNVRVICREGATEDSKWLYQQAPISLSISLPVEGYSSNRLYNILASGGFCLALWFPGIEEMFVNHHHLVWFKSAEEAASLAKHYLAHPEERKTIAAAGHREYLKSHTAESRVKTLLEMLDIPGV